MIHPTPPFPTVRVLEKVADPGRSLHAQVSMLVYVEAVLSAQRVDDRRVLALTGGVHLPELRAEISMHGHSGHDMGNGSGTSHVAIATIVPRGSTMAIPLQYIEGPVPDVSDVWALIPGQELDPPWTEHYVGLLEAKPLIFDQHVAVSVTVNATFSHQDSPHGPAANVEVVGELCFERPMHIRLQLRDPRQSTARFSESDIEEAVLIAAGSRVPIPPQRLSILAVRDQWMTVRLIDAGRRIAYADLPLTQRAS